VGKTNEELSVERPSVGMSAGVGCGLPWPLVCAQRASQAPWEGEWGSRRGLAARSRSDATSDAARRVSVFMWAYRWVTTGVL